MTTTMKLKSGATLVVEHIPQVKSVSMGIWVKAGPANETAALNGISHYIEHMMFKGTEKRTAKELASDVDKIGSQFNAFTGKEATCYYIKTLSSNLGRAAEILLDMVVNSKMDAEDMEKERQVVYEEMKMVQDTPDDDVIDMAAELVFNGHPLGRPILGTPETLSTIDRETLMGYLNSEYTTDSIVVSITGNFDEYGIVGQIEESLDKLQTTKNYQQEEMPPYKKGFKVKIKDIEQTHICLAVPSLPLGHKDYYAMSLLCNVMGGSMSSRLFQNIREEKGLAYSVYSASTSYSNAGYFVIYAGVSHNKIEDAIQGIKEELLSLKKDGLTEEELSIAKEQLKSAYIFSQENVSNRMFSLGKNMTIMGEIVTQEEVLKAYDSVTMEDIRRVSELICDMNKYSAAAITNKEIDLQAIVER